ncbi:MAG: polysaccharide pyruvyl transferase family protein [Anaerolineaceae bacterium]
MTKPTIITIFGGDSWVNRGDEAILMGTIKLLQSIEVKPSIHILTGNCKKTQDAFPNCEAVNRNNILSIIVSFKKSDLIIWGGGHLLQNSSSKVFLIHQMFILWLAILLKKKIMSFCIGAERISGRFGMWLARVTLNHVDVITVRDSFSKKVVEDLGIIKTPILIPDPALLIEPDDMRFSDKEQRLYFIVSVRQWFDYRSSWFPVSWRRSINISVKNTRFINLIETISKGCDLIIEKYKLQAMFISMYPGHGQADENVAKLIIEKMQHSEMAFVCSPDQEFMSFHHFLSSAKFLIGMRMHATMLAATANTPIIGIYYQNKGREFLEYVGQVRLAIPVETVTTQAILESADYVMSHLNEIKTDLKRSIESQQANVLAIRKLVSNLLDRDRND